MILPVLAQLTEYDKRVLISLLSVIFIVFVLIGFIGSIIVRVMKFQGKKLDTLCNDVVVTRVVTDKKQFVRYARRKNWNTFLKEAYIPLLIFATAWLVYLFTCIFTNNFGYNVFDHEKEGFLTLFFLWNFDGCYGQFFGITLINKWPTELINTPHFSVQAIGSYIFVPLFLVGGLWYLYSVQCLMSRTLRIHKLAHSIYTKSLENYNVGEEQRKDISNLTSKVNHSAPQPKVEVIQKDDDNYNI